MKKIHNLLNLKTAKNLSGIMKNICYLIMFLLTAILILSFMGRLEYSLTTTGENYPNAIYAEENHDFDTRALTISSQDDVYISTQSEDGKIEPVTYISLVLMYSLAIIPTIFAYFFLSKIFGNIEKGEIFVKENAHYLLYFAIIRIAVAVVLPFIKLLIVQITNIFVTDIISISVGSNMLNDLIPNIAFLVAAYIINYGVNLQEEVDATV